MKRFFAWGKRIIKWCKDCRSRQQMLVTKQHGHTTDQCCGCGGTDTQFTGYETQQVRNG